MRKKWIWITLVILFIVLAPTDANHVILGLIAAFKEILLAIIAVFKSVGTAFNLH
jgi:hypothetical protein